MSMRPLTYAGRWDRLFANLIDSAILLLPAVFMAALLRHEGLATLATFLLSLAYSTHFNASNWQATPGKRLMNMYVIRTDRRRLSQRDALERFLAYSLPSLPLYASFIPENIAPLLVFWLSIFWFFPIILTPERTGKHDQLCNTRVIIGRVGA